MEKIRSQTIHTFALILLFTLLFTPACKKNGPAVSLDPVQDQPFTVETDGQLDPLANSQAEKGGDFTLWGGPFPKSFNVWIDPNSFSGDLMSLFFEPLAELHVTKNTMQSVLASSWNISPDKKTFTFKIDPDAAWSDGKPITAADFQFYYDVIMNKKHLTTVFRVELGRLHRPEIIDDKTLRIRAKGNHWSNFYTAAGLIAFPAHIWKDKDFNKINFEFPVVSGPYQLHDVKKNRYVLLKRRGDWWARSKRYNQYKYNFDYLRYRFISDRDKALESFKKGSLDLYPIYTASIWAKKTLFEAVEKNQVVRQRVFNRQPRGFQGFSMNLRRPIFQDARVREALCYLLNRKQMNDKFMYNEYFLLNSFYPDLYPNNVNPGIATVMYNPEKARALLKAAGWKVGDDGILAKNGQKFAIKFLNFSEEKRHLELYISDLKKVGIQATIEQTSLATVRQRLDKHDFDMYWIATGAGRLRDPESPWHSRTANEVATNNLSGVTDKEIDRLIEKQKSELDLDRRNQIIRQIDQRLMKIIPYVLLWQIDHSRLLYWNKFGTPQYVLGKYGDESQAVAYWWLDRKKSESLSEAQKNGSTLPDEPERVIYREP